MNTPADITAKLEAIRTNARATTPEAKERIERLCWKRLSFLMGFASFYTVLPEGEWISITKASIACGGTSGMGQEWATAEARDMAAKGYLDTKKKGNRQWVRPFNTAALLEWAKLPANLAQEGMTLEQWAEHGASWVEHMREQ